MQHAEISAYIANARSIAWRPSPVAPRVHLKDLAAAAGWVMRMVRIAPGGVWGLEAAPAPRFIYVLDGELLYRGARAWPGAVIVDPPGASAEAGSEAGCTLLAVAPE